MSGRLLVALQFISSLITATVVSPQLCAHDGPDPIGHWQFQSKAVEQQRLKARIGPDAEFTVEPKVLSDEFGDSVHFGGTKQFAAISNSIGAPQRFLPKQDMTVSAWVAIEEGVEWGGILGMLQDNGGAERGWILGYSMEQFYFGLASEGGNDAQGDGRLTYLKGKTRFEAGRYYHVAAVYDGQTMQLFVNGKLDAESTEQSGPILYPETAPFVLGAYKDDDEFYPLRGRLRDVALYDLAAKAEWVSQEFDHHRQLVKLASFVKPKAFEWEVRPFLQYGTQTGMTVVWRTTTESSGKLYWGETAECEQVIESAQRGFIHQVRIEELSPETQYFYRVETSAGEDETLVADTRTFQTAVQAETPFAFAVISDTQGNPGVSGPIAEMAWAGRPNFVLHPGDLVSTGNNARHWTDHFFSSMEPLISRVPLFPVLGNHEQNSQNYFDYMALPDPEYYYQFTYGNTDFFMLDTNRNVDPGSEQYVWIDKALADSKATWKIVCHHHPPYSSDENDYGNLWKTNKGTRGDLRVRQLVKLYEQHGVDIVWTGHIHSYERTWPVREGRAVNEGGTIYMVTGGGGGGLETPGPFRPFFQNNVRRGHHYNMVYVNGSVIELKAFDLEGTLFDYTKIEKLKP